MRADTDGPDEHDAAGPDLSLAAAAAPYPVPTMPAPTEPGWYIISRPRDTVQLVEVVRYPGTQHLMAFSTEMGWCAMDNPFLAWRGVVPLPAGAAGWSGL